MSTLILHKTMHGLALKDAGGAFIGWFNTVEAAQAWCKENGYKMRVQQ